MIIKTDFSVMCDSSRQTGAKTGISKDRLLLNGINLLVWFMRGEGKVGQV